MHTSLPTATTRRRRRRGLLLATTALFVLGGACSSDDDSTDRTATVDTTADAVTDADTTELEDAVDELVVVCRNRDQNRLSDLSGAGTQDRLRDRDSDSLFTEVDALSVHSRQVVVDGDDATVTVTLEVSIDGEISEVERVWTYERVDDGWVLADVPDCLFR